MAELERAKEVYDDLRERDQVVTLSFLAHDLRRHNVSLKGPKRSLFPASSLSTFGEARCYAASGHKGGTDHTI
jgi:hypothetical protein